MRLARCKVHERHVYWPRLSRIDGHVLSAHAHKSARQCIGKDRQHTQARNAKFKDTAQMQRWGRPREANAALARG